MCQLFAGQPRENYHSQTRSLRLNGQSTSIRLEGMFWHTLDKIAKSESLSTPQFISKLHSEVMDIHGEAKNFTSLLRCTCLVHTEQITAKPARPSATMCQSDDVHSTQALSSRY